MAATSLCLSSLVSSAAAPVGGAITSQNQIDVTATGSSSGAGSIRFCRNTSDLKQLHARITKKGLCHDQFTLARLIAACAEIATSESLEYAKKALDQFKGEERSGYTAYVFNSLIRGYSAAGLGDEAILLYIGMVAESVVPDNYTFPFVLSACAEVVAYREGVQIHGSAVKMGLQEDVFLQNSLIHFYFECGEVVFGRKVFDEMFERNVVSWTSLICGYARRDRPREAVSLFFDMVAEGLMPNSVTMVCVISACAKLGDLDFGERVCAFIGKSGIKVNTLLVNALVDMYMKCGAIDHAKRLFDECVDRNLVLYNTILSNHVRQGLAREALPILNEMLQQGPQPDRVTMLSAISAAAQLGDFSLGKLCHGYVLRKGLEGWDSISNAIIDMYAKCGKQELACRVFHQMSDKTVVSWNSLIAGFVRSGDMVSAWELFNEMPETDLVSWNTIIGALVQESLFEDAIEFFRIMQCERIKADKVTMVSVASACGYLGALDLANWTYAYIERNGIHTDLQLNTALIDMFARCGDCRRAMLIFNRMKERDVSAWTAAIAAMTVEGNGERAIELFNEMVRQGVKPDEVVFVELLMACSHTGLVEQGKNFLRSMTEIHGISPQIIHFGCMVDLLGRAGLVDEALDVIKGMPMEPNDVVWGALLAACRKHENEKMAAYAAERIAEAAEGRSGIQVLLSNIYASAGKWAEVAKVRLHMKEKGVRKVPGSSSIEVDGRVHEFTSGDESHSEMTRISAMLDEMNCRLGDAGHVPDLTNVLVDVDEQEKELLLSRHSEKVAIAFGLVSTAQGIPIRVVKNLRMCSDCHSFAKLASKVYERPIAVRDNNRFHFFQQGRCSCNDYW